MTYNEKKSLYESIMKDIAKTVKKQINEANIREMKLSENGYINLLTRGLDLYLTVSKQQFGGYRPQMPLC